MTRFSAYLVACVLTVAPAQAQRANPDSVTIRALMDSARTLGLPERPLRSLLEEGKQRNEPPARVIDALRKYVSVLRRARTALGTHASEAEIDAGASVLLSGASERSITAIRSARPDGDVTVALVTLGDLVDRGVAISRAEDAIVTLTRIGASDIAFNEFRAGVQADLTSGQTAESSLVKRTRETVTRLQTLGPRKPPPFGFEQMTLFSASRISSEGLATLGRRRENGGVELGTGVTLAQTLTPQFPVFAGAWLERGSTTFRVEARLARASVLPPPSGLQSFTSSRASVSLSDSGGKTPPVTVTPPQSTDSSATHGGAGVARSVSELRFGITRAMGQFTLEGATGVQFVDERPADSWASLSIAADILPRFALLGGATSRRLLADVSAPRGARMFLGLQWHPARAARVPKPAVVAASVAPSATVWRTDDGVSIELSATAHAVSIAGDFTGWRIIPMVRTGTDRWRISVPAGFAVVRLRVAIDDGAWIVPPGIPRGRSAFGDEVGVLVVNEPAGDTR